MKGFCYLGPPEGKDAKRHLKIILTEPNRDGLVFVASVTSLKDSEEQVVECLLRKGDHPFIKHDSVVDFKRAVAKLGVDIISGQFSGELAPKEGLEPAVFERILQAARASREPSRRIRSMLFSAL